MVKTKYEILARDFFTCQNPECGKHGEMETLQLAHCVKQGKQTEQYIYNYILRKYNIELNKKDIRKIMHDEKNLITSCPKCNDLFNIYYKPELRDKKIDEIFKTL
jgi:hypothetical protein